MAATTAADGEELSLSKKKRLQLRADGRLVLESGSPLSRSMLWSLQRQFYEENGVDAWAKGIVPNYVTTK